MTDTFESRFRETHRYSATTEGCRVELVVDTQRDWRPSFRQHQLSRDSLQQTDLNLFTRPVRVERGDDCST
jgi:hypothetical protein